MFLDKKFKQIGRYLVVTLMMFVVEKGSAQVTLGTSPYMENFNGIGAGLPTGWSVRFGSTPTALGTNYTFITTATVWANSTGSYRNSASANVSNATDNAATQAGRTDRAPSVKNSGSGLVEGQGAFAMQLPATTGKYGFQISFKAQLLDVQGRTNTFLVDYGFGASPGTFTQAAAPFTFTDRDINGGAFGQRTITINFGDALDNNSSTIWIRIANLVTSTGSGSRCTFGIDDVNLTWSTTPSTVTLSSSNPAVPVGNIVAGSLINLLYQANVTVANAATSLTALNITTAGTYAATDLTNLKLWYQNNAAFNAGTATLISTKTTGLAAGLQTFTGLNQAYPTGTGYLFVTADVPCGAITGNTINITTPVASDFTFGSTVPTGTLFAGSVKTITPAVLSNVTGQGTVPGNAELDIFWTNPGCFDEIMVIATDNPGGVTSVPTGNGSQYTQNTVYNDGTNDVNLNLNEFCIYKGSLSPVNMTNLINGTTYRIKIFTRLGTTWSSGAVTNGTPIPASNGDFRSISSGNWNTPAIWEVFSGTWGPAGSSPNSIASSVTIRAGHTITLNIDNPAVKGLTVDAGGKLFCGNTLVPRYLSVFGNIICNGTIGNTIQDNLSFNIDGPTCSISGTGAFSCDRIRKNTGANGTTTVTANMNITTWWGGPSSVGGTAIFNNFSGTSAFNFIVAAGKTVTCTNNGSVAIDGTNGLDVSYSYGSLTVNGTLNITDTLFMRTNNIASYNCSVSIGAAGTINAKNVVMASGGSTATHTFNMAAGGRLNITGISGITGFSTVGNIYNLSAGSTVEYSAIGNQPVESGLPYSNLTLSGSGIKTSNGNISVGNIFNLVSGSFNQFIAPNYYTTNIAANGTLTGNGGNFVTGDAGGTINFLGNGSINGTTVLTFNVLKINAGTVTNSLNGSSADTLNLTGGSFVIGAGNIFNMVNNAVVTATAGNFASGAAGGIINFSTPGKFSGNSDPYDVYASNGVDFGTGTVTIQSGGSFRINNGGYANTNGPFYANGSTLLYNNGNTFNAGTEWYALQPNGRGVPFNVQIGTTAISNTKVDFNASNAWRQMNGSLFIGPATGGANYGLILSTVYGGDIIVGGSWTRSPTATFTANTRAVTFNGSPNSVITLNGGGTETFAYLIINKAPGQNVVLQGTSPNATNVAVQGGGGSNAFQLLNGSLDLNQQTFKFASFFNASQNNIAIDGTAGNLTRDVFSTGGAGIFEVYNADAVTHNITINRLNTGTASLLVFGSTVTVTTGGVGSGGGGINFGNALTTINGTLQINSFGFVTGNAPTYGTNSFLVYNSSGSFDRNVEWGTLTGPGYPWNVVVQNNTNLQLNFPAVNGSADRAIAGNLSIVPGSSLLVGTTGAFKLTVGGNLQLNGTLTLPAVFGGDLYVRGKWTRPAGGVFTPNDRAVFFYGTGKSSITADGGQDFPYLYLTKNASVDTVALFDDISVTKEMSVITGTFELNAKNATLKSDQNRTATFGQVGAGGNVAYSGVGRFIVERYIPTGLLAGQHIKSWQFLAVPDNGGQTINAGWQEGNVLPVVGATGLGTIVSNATAGAGFDIIGGVGPSLKTFDAAATAWTGVANTALVPLHNPKGYFLFVRGDRTVSTWNAAPTQTTLRSTGKLFVPGSNPPPVTTVLAGKFASIGNPYASAIDFLNITKPAAPAVDDVFYVWDPLLPGSYLLGGFQTISSSNGYKPNPGGTANYSSATAYTKIQSGQAFMVHATGAGGNVSFTENAKVGNSDMVYRQADAGRIGRHYFRTQLYTEEGNIADANVVAFDANFNNAYEANDALKISHVGENFDIISQSMLLAIEARKPVMRSDTLQYVFSHLRTRNYQLRFGPEAMASTGLTAWLEDSFLQSRTFISLLDSTVYNFTITQDPASAVATRFRIVFLKITRPPAADGPLLSGKGTNEKQLVPGKETAGSISVYPNPVVNSLMQLDFKHNQSGNYNLQLSNSSGQAVFEQTISVTPNAKKSVRIGTLTAGYYTLVVTAPDASKMTTAVIIE